MIHEIQNKFERFLEEMPFKRNFYHLNSIRNFIIHFSELSNANDKEIVAQMLIDYLDLITETDIDNPKEAKEIFLTFVYPIGKIYKKKVGFKYVITSTTIIAIFIIFNLIVFQFRPSIYLYGFLTILGIAWIIYMFRLRKSTKVFGYRM